MCVRGGGVSRLQRVRCGVGRSGSGNRCIGDG